MGQSFKMRYAAVFAYGVPFLIVLMNASIALGYADRNISGIHYFIDWLLLLDYYLCDLYLR